MPGKTSSLWVIGSYGVELVYDYGVAGDDLYFTDASTFATVQGDDLVFDDSAPTLVSVSGDDLIVSR